MVHIFIIFYIWFLHHIIFYHFYLVGSHTSSKLWLHVTHLVFIDPLLRYNKKEWMWSVSKRWQLFGGATDSERRQHLTKIDLPGCCWILLSNLLSFSLSSHTYRVNEGSCGNLYEKSLCFCCCRSSAFRSSTRNEWRLSFPETNSQKNSLHFCWLRFLHDFLPHWVLLKASRHGRWPALIHKICFELLLAKFDNLLFLLPQKNSLSHFTKKLSLEAQRCMSKPNDRLNRATASEKLKMMCNFPSAFSRVPNRHSQRPLSNFPHAHIAEPASPYFEIINKSMSSQETRWK